MPTLDLATGELHPDAPLPPPSLAARKVMLQDRVKAIRDDREFAGADTPFGRVQTDLYSQGKINGLVTEASIAITRGENFLEGFGMADNSVVVLSAEDTITMGRAMSAYIKALFARSFVLRAAINAAADHAALDAIDVEAGWP